MLSSREYGLYVGYSFAVLTCAVQSLSAIPPTTEELVGSYSAVVQAEEVVVDDDAQQDESVQAFIRIVKERRLTPVLRIVAQADGKLSFRAGDPGESLQVSIPIRFEHGMIFGKTRDAREDAELVVEYELLDVEANYVSDPADKTVPLDRLVRLQGKMQMTVVESKVDKIRKIRYAFTATSKHHLAPDPSDPTDLPHFGEDSGAAITSISREVEVHRWKDSEWVFVEFADPRTTKLKVGDKIVVREESNVVVSFADHSVLVLQPSAGQDEGVAIIALPDTKQPTTLMEMYYGRLKVNVRKAIAGEAIEVKSQQTTLGVKGTVFEVECDSDHTTAKVVEGTVEARHNRSNELKTIRAGQQITATNSSLGEVEPFDVPSASSDQSVGERGAYMQAGGLFTLVLPPGWQVISQFRNKIADRGSDTLKDPSGRFIIIVRTQVDRVEKPDDLWRRWLAATLATDKSLLDPQYNQLRISRIQIGPLQGMRLTYAIAGEQIVSRMALVHEGRWCVINTISPAEFGTAELPAETRVVLDTLTIASPAAYDETPDSLGQQIAHEDTLDGLSRDYGITVFENGITVHDHVRGKNQSVRIAGRGYPILPGGEAFLAKDPARKARLGEPVSPETPLFDYRLGVQIFDGGVVVHVPTDGLLWQFDHPQRNQGNR